ncbi:hypothetical protein ACV07N_00620 [Roseivirga echinicomitans]
MLSNVLNIEGVSLLPKEQQKAINGGYIVESGTCAVIVFREPGFSPDIYRNISYETTQQAIAAGGLGGRWCCDSCDEATWLQ